MKRSLTLDDTFRVQLRRLPPQVRARAGEALLALAAEDDAGLDVAPHPSHPDDRYIRQVRGLGYTMTVLLYDHIVDAIGIYSDG